MKRKELEDLNMEDNLRMIYPKQFKRSNHFVDSGPSVVHSAVMSARSKGLYRPFLTRRRKRIEE